MSRNASFFEERRFFDDGRADDDERERDFFDDGVEDCVELDIGDTFWADANLDFAHFLA